MERIDTLIRAAHVIPVQPRTVLADHAVAIRGGRIVAVLPAAEALARYEAARVIELPRHALLPGFVNLHCHAAMTLLRGVADDMPLMTWLQDHIWPAEAAHGDDEFVHDGSLLAFAEMLRGGVTCVNDMYFFPAASARAALRAGIRTSLGIIAISFPSAYASDPSDYLHKGLATRDAYQGESLIRFTIAPHAPYTVDDATLRRMVTLAEELDMPIHTHVHETSAEVEQSLAQHGVRPLERLRNLGVVGPRLVAAHAIHVDDAELDLLAREGVTVAHCPSSNLKLASGFAPVGAMRKRGIAVGVGTDGAASNNRLDVMTEMRTAALLAKASSGDASAVNAYEAIEMATLAGARALGLGDEIGSLQPGKQADLAAIELSDLEVLPCYDPVSDIVYSAGREHVTHTWVAGELRLEDRRLVGLDPSDLRDKALWWRGRIAP
jgi:5-methylthioadenosine/S-adenosylhomocysteine deaminase